MVIDELIELGGLRLHFRDWAGPGPDASALVVLHGYTGHARTWDAFAEGMRDRYRVIALDHRGHGESGWAADGYAIKAMAADLEAFVKALDLKAYSLLGLSMGGMVAIEYAGRAPRRLAALSIVDIGPELDPEGVRRIRERQAESDSFASREEAFAAARAADPRPPEAHHRHRVDLSLMRTADGRWTWRYDRALRAPGALVTIPPAEAWASCAAIAVPTQIIRGAESDILSPAIAARMVETIRDCRLDEVAGAGHAVPLDRPDGFLAAARDFLRG